MSLNNSLPPDMHVFTLTCPQCGQEQQLKMNHKALAENLETGAAPLMYSEECKHWWPRTPEIVHSLREQLAALNPAKP